MSRPTPSLRRCTLGLAYAALATAVTAQNRLLVPSQFAQIGAAVQAATPGTIIEVQWQVQPYLPFVIDRDVTIVGNAGEQQAPRVEVTQGVGIDFQLAPGERATLSRIDVSPAVSATLTQSVRIQGGIVTLEDCRFRGGRDPLGTAGLATLDATDAEVRISFSRLEGNGGAIGLRALRSRISATKSRFFGGTMPAADGVQLVDSHFHGTECWLFGGEDFFNAPGATGLRAGGTTQAWFVDSIMVGGMGQPGGIGLINTSTTPIEWLRSGAAGGLNLGSTGNAPASVGSVVTNPVLIGLSWSEPPYRRGTLRPGTPWAVHALTAPGTWALLAVSFAPTSTAAQFTRQPAVLVQDVAYAILVQADSFGYASHTATLPSSANLTGIGLWVQAVAGLSFPLEASPLTGVVVRF